MEKTMTLPDHVPPHLVFEFDIYADPRVSEDIQQSCAAALSGAPAVFYTPRNGGHWIARRMGPAALIMKDAEHFSSRELRIPRVPNQALLLPLNLDPPDCFPYRQVMLPVFSQKGVKTLEPRLRAWAERILDGVAAKDGCDFVEDVASLFPVSVFMEFMGLPMEKLREFRPLANAFFKARDPASIDQISAQIVEILAAEIARRRRQPGGDLISQFIASDALGRPMTDDEILAMSFLLFLGGMDTVTNLMSFSFRHLAGDPSLQARLGEDPDLIPKFVEESLRCFPVVNPSRLVVRDCDLYGAPMRPGDMLICLLSEAGRDESVNPDPHRFDVDREGRTHLGFSAGPHFCVGHLLARAEIRILLEEWLKRIPAFGHRPGPPRPFRTGVVFALESLPLEWPTPA